MNLERWRRLASSLLGRRLTVRMTEPFYRLMARWETARHLQSLPTEGLLVNLGCGYHPFPGWVNVDLARGYADVVWDIRQGLPFQEGTCRVIFGEHLIEHLTREEALHLATECYRVLEPGGIVRISTPDSEKFLRSYVANDGFLFSPAFPEIIESPIDRINLIMRAHGHHLWAYDETSLRRLLQQAGFNQIVRQTCQSSLSIDLADRDHPDREFESLYLEARKEARKIDSKEPGNGGDS